MNSKFLSIFILLGLSLLMFTSCEKINSDNTTNEEEEVTPVVIVCDDFQGAISHDGFGLLAVSSGGGVAPFTYLWSTGETTETITVTEEGTYSVTVTDNDGCELEAETTVIFTDPCDLLTLEIGDNPANEDITAFPEGGTEPYEYLWSTGETTATISVSESGTYSVVVVDASGCMIEGSIEVTVNDPCDGFEAQVDEEPMGSGQLTVYHNGSAPFVYLWSTGESSISITVTEDGTYSCSVTDANGCVAEEEITVIVDTSPCAGFSVVIAEQPPGSNDLYTAPTGGTSPYTFLWSTGEITANITAPGSGTYSVSVTDADGCIAADEITI